MIQSSELLGSVTTDSVRSSARVIQSKKVVRIEAVTPQIEKREANSEISIATPKTPSQQKHIRIQWTVKEKKFFFDALNDHGRDFEQISRFINVKMKRKNPTEVDYKTKDHVRQHYYQLFQKASKYLKFSDDVKKLAQELYVLINYGEMKKKLIMSSEKSFLKLRDLVYRGSITVRVKGKNIKIKTPSCRALKKLNQLEGNNVEDIQLPQRIDVILRPSNLHSWTYVQQLAQNPRIKVSLPLQKRILSLLQTLEQKWRSHNIRLQEKYIVKIIQQNGRQKLCDDIIKQSESDAELLKSKESSLCFHPPENCKIFRPMIQLNELLSSYNLCLNSYETRIGARTRGEEICMEKNSHIKDFSKNSSKRIRNDSSSEKTGVILSDLKKVKTEENNIEELGILFEYKSNDSNDSDTKKKECKIQSIIKNVDEVVEKQESIEDKKDVIETDVIKSKVENFTMSKAKKSILYPTKCHKEYSFKPLINEEALKKIREGWTIKNVGDLTIGDLYLMYGSDAKLILEYKWIESMNEIQNEKLEQKIEQNNLGSKLKHLVMVASLIDNPNGFSTINNFTSNRNLEKNFTETKEIGESSTFKHPSFETFIRPNVNPPRLKPHQSSRWWRNQQYNRYRTDGSISNYFKHVGNQNHVVRNLYQMPSTSQTDVEILNQNNDTNQKYSDEVTKILEDKIQNLSKQTPTVQNFSESSRSSIKSLLESLSGSSNRSNYEYGKK